MKVLVAGVVLVVGVLCVRMALAEEPQVVSVRWIQVMQAELITSGLPARQLQEQLYDACMDSSEDLDCSALPGKPVLAKRE